MKTAADEVDEQQFPLDHESSDSCSGDEADEQQLVGNTTLLRLFDHRGMRRWLRYHALGAKIPGKGSFWPRSWTGAFGAKAPGSGGYSTSSASGMIDEDDAQVEAVLLDDESIDSDSGSYYHAHHDGADEHGHAPARGGRGPRRTFLR